MIVRPRKMYPVKLKLEDHDSSPLSVGVLLTVSCRLLIGIVLIYAGILKARYPVDFLGSVYEYGIVNRGAGLLMASVLPLIEISLGFCLMANTLMPGASLLSACLFFIFTCALSIAAWNNSPISCGCFGGGDTVTWWTVLRSFAFFFLCVFLYAHQAWERCFSSAWICPPRPEIIARYRFNFPKTSPSSADSSLD